MANDPLSPVVRGQILAITASAWNEAMGAARDRRQAKRPKSGGRPAKQLGYVEALALNSTGADLREHKPCRVTAAGGYDLTVDRAADHWQGQPLLTLGVPAASTDFVVVTQQAIPAGKIGRVAIAGTCLCDVHVNSSGHGFAAPTTNTTALESASSGAIRILHKGTGNSTRRCLVYLGDQIPAASGSTTNTLAWNGSSSLLTSTVNSVAATATVALASQQTVLGSAVTLNQAYLTQQSILTLSLTTGTYVVQYAIQGAYQTNTTLDYLYAHLELNSAHVNGSNTVFCCVQATGTQNVGCASNMAVVTVPTGVTYTLDLRAGRFFQGTVSTSVINAGSGIFTGTRLTAVKIG